MDNGKNKPNLGGLKKKGEENKSSSSPIAIARELEECQKKGKINFFWRANFALRFSKIKTSTKTGQNNNN